MKVLSIIPGLGVFMAPVLAQTLVTGQLGNATVVNNNPVGKEAVGTLPAAAFWTSGSLNGNVKGSVTVKSGANGMGVDYTVKFSNLPKEGGPFPFHIHDKAVPAHGNCTATAAHLDPTLRGEDPVCNSTYPQTCQVGDLAGKYGKITSDPYEATFHDAYGSMNIGSNASIIDRSFVVHFSNKTRITCANFVISATGNGTAPYNTTTTTSSSAPTATSTTPASSSSVPVTAGAGALGAGKVLQSFAAIPLLALLYLL